MCIPSIISYPISHPFPQRASMDCDRIIMMDRDKAGAEQMGGESAEERKRMKRKRNKQKLRAKLQEVKEKAMQVFKDIVKDIYSLSTTYEAVEYILEQCFSLQGDSEVLYNSIDTIMRGEIQTIRRRILTELTNLPKQPDEAGRNKTARNVFQCVRRIQEGSPQIQKIINLFVKRRFGAEQDDPPFKTNLDLVTLKFLYKNDLQPSNHFAALVDLISQSAEFQKERQIYAWLIEAAAQPEESQEFDWSGYQSEDEEEEEPVQQRKPSEDQEEVEEDDQAENTRRKQRRRARKKKGKVDIQTTFESILQRTQELQINEAQRQECKVEQGWLERMRQLRGQYCRSSAHS